MVDIWGETAAPLFLIGTLAGLAVLLLDWRLTLPGAGLLQFVFGQLMAVRYQLPMAWVLVYTVVVLLAVLILLSPMFQGRARPPISRRGDLAFRGLLLILAALLLLSVDVHLVLPVVDGPVGRLILWMVGCALLILSLSDGVLHTGIGLLLWLITAQTVLTTLIPAPVLVALFGGLLLAVSLACSYLLLAENTGLAALQKPPTDITFPAPGPDAESRARGAWRRLFAWRLVRIWYAVAGPGQGVRS